MQRQIIHKIPIQNIELLSLNELLGVVLCVTYEYQSYQGSQTPRFHITMTLISLTICHVQPMCMRMIFKC